MTGQIVTSGGTLGLQLGKLYFSLARNELYDESGSRIRLRPQPLKFLQLLAENNGSVVSKDILAEAVWPDLTVSDDSLTQCVADIRKTLDDKDRMILRTVPKYGYVLQAHSPPGAPDTRLSALGKDDLLSQPPEAVLLIAPQPTGMTASETEHFLDLVSQTVQ